MNQKLAVIGLGKLGLCTAACFARASYPVAGMDIRKDWIAMLKDGQCPLQEPGLSDLLGETRDNLSFTSDLDQALAGAGVCFIVVPTPSREDGAFSNQYVIEVLEQVASRLDKMADFPVVAVVSTVMPGSGTDVFIPLLEEMSSRKAGTDFGYAYNPEFIAIGSVIRDFLHPDLVLIGESDPKTGAIIEKIYDETCNNSPFMAHATVTEAEIAKLAINCYCTMKISFANNIGNLCDSMHGVDAGKICAILGQDSRIGSKYIRPGLGFGGPCFPRDNEAFIRFAHDLGGWAELQEATVAVNNRQPRLLAEKILRAARSHGSVVALLGQSYKPGTALTERSQAVEIAHELAIMAPGLELRVYDPMARESGPWVLADGLAACVKGANVVAILTPWEEFQDLGTANLMDSNAAILNFWR